MAKVNIEDLTLPYLCDQETIVMDADALTQNGHFRTRDYTENLPQMDAEYLRGGHLMNYAWDSNAIKQIFYPWKLESVYSRSKSSGTWGKWEKIS